MEGAYHNCRHCQSKRWHRRLIYIGRIKWMSNCFSDSPLARWTTTANNNTHSTISITRDARCVNNSSHSRTYSSDTGCVCCLLNKQMKQCWRHYCWQNCDNGFMVELTKHSTHIHAIYTLHVLMSKSFGFC